MTRICSYCKTDLGEKCGKCGYPPPLPLIDGNTIHCYVCGYTWTKGTDGETHGICEPPCAEAIAMIEGKPHDAITQ